MKPRLTGLAFILAVIALSFTLQVSVQQPPNPNSRRVIGKQRDQASPPTRQESVPWSVLLERETEYGSRLMKFTSRLDDARLLLDEQLERVERNEYLDLAALRIEQILRLIEELDEALGAIERYYSRTTDVPTSDRQRFERKCASLANLRQSTTGEIALTRLAFRHFIVTLESRADIESARHARERFSSLCLRLDDFVRRLDHAQIINDSLVRDLIDIEMKLRRLTWIRWRSVLIDEDGPRVLIRPVPKRP